MFSPDDVKKAITDALNTDITIPEGHRAALVTFVNTDKAELAFAQKINDQWSVELVADHNWTGGNDVGFISKVTW